MNFLHNDLAQVSNMVGRMALATVSVVNTQHELGLDLKGLPGGEFFTALTLPSGVQTSGVSGLTASVGVSDPTQFMASDYELRYDGTNYTAVRLSDGTVSAPVATVPVSFDGLSFNLSGPATAGDVFRFKPFENAAREIKIAITSPDSVAAAVLSRCPLSLETPVASPSKAFTPMVLRAVPAMAPPRWCLLQTAPTALKWAAHLC